MPAALTIAALLCISASADSMAPDQRPLERAFWLSLTLTACERGYWSQDPAMPGANPPTPLEIQAAVDVLIDEYHANRLYLVYHRQCSAEDARQLLVEWRDASAGRAEVVPTFLPMDYSNGLDPGAPVFASEDLTEWSRWVESGLGAPAIALYDVYPNRPWEWAVDAIEWGSDLPIGHVGIQPEEDSKPGIDFVVIDTWSAVNAYRNNADWTANAREWLQSWASFLRPGVHQTFDLICVAWDYDYSDDGGTAPPYDDTRDDPLPAGRNSLAAQAIREAADPELFAGFASDLVILHAHTLAHEENLYADLRAGRRYTGKFSVPLDEIAEIFASMEDE